MSAHELQQCLSIQEQKQVINNIQKLIFSAPLHERIFLSHGDAMAGAVLFTTSLHFWRVGFRAFNLYKYGKGRIIVTFTSLAQGTIAGVIHSVRNTSNLLQLCRPEGRWHYGFQSFVTHQICIVTSLAVGLGHPFLHAHLNGMIPIRFDTMHKASTRKEAFKYVYTKLRPHTKGILATYLVSSAAMFAIGVLEYDQTCNFLAKLNRKTISFKED